MNLFKAKTDKEIEEVIKAMSVDELLTHGAKTADKNIILYAIEKANTNVWAYDYNESSVDFMNAVNTKHYWELLDIDEEQYVILRRIVDGTEEDVTLKFFANRYSPIYKDDRILKETKDTIKKDIAKNIRDLKK